MIWGDAHAPRGKEERAVRGACLELALYQRPIGLLHLAPGERVPHLEPCFSGPGDQLDTGRAVIESVTQAGLAGIVAHIQAFGIASGDGIGKRARLSGAKRVTEEPGWFRNGDERIVFVEYGKLVLVLGRRKRSQIVFLGWQRGHRYRGSVGNQISLAQAFVP